ncbi:MAG: glycosyltransferase [Lachnospiraceae bacterium]|nr:glycosyltransferase [Lachnospiraceae bacterium]
MTQRKNNGKISVVIPTFNHLSRLKLTLASIDIQKMDVDKFEVIIVNDGSTDGSAEYLKKRKTEWNLRVINQKNAGRAAARNRGALEAEGEIILFCDDDCILSPDFIAAHYHHQKEYPRILHGRIVTLTQMKFFEDPSRGILVCHNEGLQAKDSLMKRIITESDIKTEFFSKIAPNQRLNSIERLIKEIFDRKKETLYWIGFTGGNVSMPLTWMKSDEMFNVEFGRAWGCEDLELGYRLGKKAYPFAYLDEAVNYHIAHAHFDFKQEVETSFSNFAALHDDESVCYLKEYLLGNIDVQTMMKQSV